MSGREEDLIAVPWAAWSRYLLDGNDADCDRVQEFQDAFRDLLAAARAITAQAIQGKVLPRDSCVAQAQAAIARAQKAAIQKEGSNGHRA